MEKKKKPTLPTKLKVEGLIRRASKLEERIWREPVQVKQPIMVPYRLSPETIEEIKLRAVAKIVHIIETELPKMVFRMGDRVNITYSPTFDWISNINNQLPNAFSPTAKPKD